MAKYEVHYQIHRDATDDDRRRVHEAIALLHNRPIAADAVLRWLYQGRLEATELEWNMHREEPPEVSSR
jgi:hypothetical protein